MQRFTDIPGEIRNEIYHIFFEKILERSTPIPRTNNLPINQRDIQYAAVNTLEPITALFLTCKQISTEARALFHGLFFARRHYLLHSRESIYSFSQVSGNWAQNIHQVHLTATGVTQGRRILNPVKVAVVKAARAYQSDPALCFQARHLELENTARPWQSTTIRRSFTADLTLNGIPTTLRVYECANDRFDVLLVGPLGKLDWTMIPLTRYTEDAAWDQLLARRSRLLIHNTSEAPLRQMPTTSDDELPEPYVETRNAGSALVTEVAEEIVQALVLELPRLGSTWSLSFR